MDDVTTSPVSDPDAGPGSGSTDAVPPARAGSAAAERLEPRALRSRTLLLEAVRAALDEQPLDALTVSALCRRAGVHRVTFYQHWPDVRAVAADAFAETIDRIATIDENAIAAASDPLDLAAQYERALEAQLREIHDHREVYRALSEAGLFSDRLFDVLVGRAQLAIDAFVRLGLTIPGAASGTAATHLAGGVAAVSAKWARADDTDAPAATRDALAQLPNWWPRTQPQLPN